MKQRLQNIDLIKLNTIFLVLLGHILMHLRSNESYHNELFLLIYSFHMPLFMAMVGFFAKGTINLKGRTFIKRKIRQLLLPTITWCFTFWLLNLIFFRFEEYMEFWKIYNSTFWFLKSAFICYSIFYLGCKVFHSILWGSLLTLLISQIFPFFNIGKMYPAFLIGVFLSYKSDKLSSLPLYITLGCFCVFFMVFFNVPVSDVLLTKFNVFTYGNNQVPLTVELSKHLIGLLLGISASVAMIIFSFSSIGKRIVNKTAIINKYGRYTLGVYCIQTFIIEILMQHYVRFDNVDHTLFTYVLSPLLSLILLTIFLDVIVQFDKNKYLSFLYFGGPNPVSATSFIKHDS